MVDINNSVYCPLCGILTKDYRIWVRTDVGNILRCNRCDLGFLDIEDSKLAIDKNELYNARTYYKLIYGLQQYLHGRYKKQLKIIKKYTNSDIKILDIGCSIGLFLKTASSNGFIPFGYDINKINLKKAEKLFGITSVNDNYLEDEIYDSFFDVITIWDVLEHMADPITFLSKLSFKLKSGGLLIVQCPNMDSYEFLRFGQHWNWLIPGDHLLFYTIKTLNHVLVKTGFKPILIKPISEGYAFSNALLSVGKKDPTLIFNRILVKILKRLKIKFNNKGIHVPVEKLIGVYGKILQHFKLAGKNSNLILIIAQKP